VMGDPHRNGHDRSDQKDRDQQCDDRAFAGGGRA
jgi:hypothetical protein